MKKQAERTQFAGHANILQYVTLINYFTTLAVIFTIFQTFPQSLSDKSSFCMICYSQNLFLYK